MNRDAETVPARHETPDVAELRRLAEAATPGPWRTEYLMGAGNDLLTAIIAGRATPDDLRVIGSTLAERDGKFIAAAVNALPILLDAAAERDALRAELEHMTEARDNARAEVERLAGEQEVLSAAVDRVRELHARESFWQYDRDQEHSYLTQQDAADESGCDCPYAPEPSADLAHTPECLATISHFDVCSECARIEYADAERQAHGEFSGYAEALWPCPTIRALDEEPQPS